MANIELDGANKKIKVDSGDLTLDVPGDIILDADGADLVFADGGTNILKVTNSSSDVVFQPQVDAKDLKFNQYDGRTLLEVNDGGFVAIANGATGPGQLRLYEDTDNGTNYTALQVGTQSGDITYTLPTADGSNGNALLTNGSGTLSWGAAGASLANDANNRVVTGDGSGGLNGEANLTFDGTDALIAAAGKIQLRDSGLYVASNADGDLDIVSDGTAVDSINIESAGGITLDAGTAASGVIYEDDGTEMLRIHNSSSDVIVEAKVQDKDIVFKGDDNGSGVTSLTLDMSEAGQLVLGAHGQINFPDSANVSTDANVLDDYQEGDMNLSSSQASNFFTGFYTKIGRMVYFTCAGTVPSSANSATQTLTGLPFTVKDQNGPTDGGDAGAGYISYESNNGKTASFVLRNNATTANFYQNDNNVATHATYSGDEFILGGIYTTDQ